MHNDARYFSAIEPELETRTIWTLRITQANMSPRHQLGEYALFEKSEPASVGDDIVVIFNDGTAITWRLDAISDLELTVHGYNPPITKTIERQSVREFWPVMWAQDGIDNLIDDGAPC
jgi:hypothetical protein